MKMIKPGYEIYNIPDATDKIGVYKYLERIARICYKSDEKINENSHIKFLNNIRERQHWTMFEHYIFTVSVPAWIYSDMNGLMYRMTQDSDALTKLGYFHSTYWEKAPRSKYKYLISFSVTSLNRIVSHPTFDRGKYTALMNLFRFMQNQYPLLTYGIEPEFTYDVDKNISFLTRDEIRNLPNWIREVHDWMAVQFTVDRGITHEIVRHRPASFAQESTRYCNYAQGKFNNEITVIIPSFFDTGMGEFSNSLVFDEWKRSCEVSERAYFKLLEYGATPQQARTVLSNSTKADIVMTASIHEFKHFFKMRCASDAHPQMLEVTRPLLLEANTENEYYQHMFDENMYLLN